MRKKSLRLISAVLAACMMTALVPAAAFADEGPQDAAGVSEQAAGTLLQGGETIADAGTYELNGTYTQPIVIDAAGDVTLNITGDVTYSQKKSFITVQNAKKADPQHHERRDLHRRIPYRRPR